jgi:hypothetical protein
VVEADPLDEVAGELYAQPPDDFVRVRDEAVAAARKAGDRELAARIGKLRRPTVGAWLVNLLAHECPDLVAELLKLGEQLRAAQRNLRGDEIRELSQRRREMVTALASRAAALGQRRARGNLPIAEVQATLTAALAEPEVAEQVRAGRLVKTVSYAGFGEPPRPQLTVLPGGRAAAPVQPAKPAPPPTKLPRDDTAERRAAKAGERRAADEAERRAADEAERRAAEEAERPAAEEAERRAAEAERRAAEAERRAEEAERRAAEREAEREAERRAREQRRRERAAAHRELLAARTELAEAEAARTAAERAVTAARRRVQKATQVANQLDAADD